jgi:molybdate transport system substrate-binding protein
MKRRAWLGLALAAVAAPARAQAGSLLVFAAASLKTALDEIAADWAKETGRPLPRLAYAASPALARQLEQGAPADLFLSADLDWMDYAASKRLIKSDTRVNLLGNKIVLVAAKDSAATLATLGNAKLAMANVDAVPAGKYGKAALQKLGAWDAVKDKVVQAENVRAALVFVARGEAALGVVYATDAAAEPSVRVVTVFPDDSHPPIVYPAAVTTNAKSADAKAFLDRLKGAQARAVFEKQGFTVLAKAGA